MHWKPEHTRKAAELSEKAWRIRKLKEAHMSKTITIPGFIYAQPASEWDTSADVVDGHAMTFFTHDGMENHGYVKVTATALTFDLPDGWDPRAQQIEALRAKEKELRAEFQRRVTEIQAQINKLQALEMA